MTETPWLLDLGYYRAGFRVEGVEAMTELLGAQIKVQL